jgi:hypothetical protein
MARIKNSKGPRRKNPRSIENDKITNMPNIRASDKNIVNNTENLQTMIVCETNKFGPLNQLGNGPSSTKGPKKRKRKDLQNEFLNTPSVIDFVSSKQGNLPVRREIKKNNSV